MLRFSCHYMLPFIFSTTQKVCRQLEQKLIGCFFSPGMGGGVGGYFFGFLFT